MRIPSIERILVVCADHLEATHSYGTAIETLLTYALVIRLYAEFEQQIQVALAEKSGSIATAAARAAFEAQVKDHDRGIRVRNLSELLASFGAAHRANWAARLAENPRAVTDYGLIVAKRHETAHSAETIANFREVRDWYESGHIVLDFFRETLFAIDPA